MANYYRRISGSVTGRANIAGCTILFIDCYLDHMHSIILSYSVIKSGGGGPFLSLMYCQSRDHAKTSCEIYIYTYIDIDIDILPSGHDKQTDTVT